MPRIALSLGSNLGDREAHLAFGRDALAARGVAWTALSSLYETEPVGPVTEQGAFLNQIAVGETELSPRALLEACLAIEREDGRVRSVRWGPRTLDLDIVLYDDSRIDEPDLTVPHVEIARRRFVLVPLCEVDPDWPIPGQGRTARDLLAALAPDKEVRIWRSSATRPPT